MRALAASALICSITACARAQPPVEREVVADALQDITTRLASPDLATVAWGAYFAATRHVAEAVPALRQRLAELAQLPAEERTCAQLAILDALVQNDASMTAAELEPFGVGFAYEPVFALLCRNPDPNRGWLLQHCRDLPVDGPWLDWVATGNVLASLRDPDFATDLLRATAVTRTITVRDPGDEDWELRVERMSVCCGSACAAGRSLEVPVGYPPMVHYSLEVSPTADSTLLTKGPYAVYLRRVEHSARRFGTGRSRAIDDDEPIRRARMRHTWLSRMLDREADQPRPIIARTFEVDWHGSAALRALIEQEQHTVRADFRALAELCVAARLTSWTALADAAPDISIRLHDVRQDTSQPLPDPQDWK
jgi:hypothetical protein